VQVAAAIVRHDEDVLLVLQGAHGEEPFWALPGGIVEDGELVVEGLLREIREETGLAVEPGRLAFVREVDELRPVRLTPRRPPVGYHLTVWVFEAARWSGELGADDPDRYVRHAEFVPRADALERLRRTAWLELVADYLEGHVQPASLLFERRHADGRVEAVARIPDAGTSSL
jgi:ADP-ribose pyrophosphatase YjhB (NUDIX family)